MNNADTDKLLEEAFDKIKSKFSGAMHAAGKFLSTGNVGVANVGYTAQSVIKRNELFKKRVGDYLSKIEQFDATGATKLNTISHIGPIAIQSQSTVSEPANGQQYASSTGLTYTYNSKAKAWFDAAGKKMGNSSMMTKKFLKKYPKGVVKENFLNESGEVFAYEREIEKEIKSFITDLANQFNVTGNNTKEILAKLEKLPVVPDLKKSITELNIFIKELGTKTKLNIKVPEVKITAPAKKSTSPTSAPTPTSTPTPSTAKKIPSGSPKMGETVNLGKYQFTFDGKDWISPIDHKPVDASLARALNVEFIKKKAAPTKTSSKKPAPKKAPTPKGGTPKDGAIDVSKKYKFDGAKKLWVNIATKVALSKPNSDSKTKAYWSAVAAKKIVPEGITKITYKEFFV